MSMRIYLRMYLVTFSVACWSFFGCEDGGQNKPKSISSTSNELNEEALYHACVVACHEIMNCEELSVCPADDVQGGLSLCLQGCERGEVEEIVSDAELVCSLSVQRAQERYFVLASCGDLSATGVCLGSQCEEGSVCNPRDGSCVDPCEGVLCDGGQECIDGACPDLCDDVTCPEGLGCFAGDCIDLCYDQRCSAGQECDPSSGQCLDLCGDTRCSFGERCDSGACIPACQDVICPEGSVCHQTTGLCVNRCDHINCQNGYECDPAAGLCRDQCEGISCAEGWMCDTGSCVFDDPCADVTCGTQELCDPSAAECVPFICDADSFEGGLSNNDLSSATRLMPMTQRLDDLTVCSFDLDWYSIVIPASASARVSLRFTHQTGDLILRLYQEHNTFTPMLEVNSESDDEYLGIQSADEERTFYLRVSSGAQLTAQNRYSLVVEMNLPGAVCNHDADCHQQTCINALCGGYGDENPDITIGDLTEAAQTSFNPESSSSANSSSAHATHGGCNADAYEPNHTLNTAMELNQMGAGPWSAQICPEDRDLYTFSLESTSDVEIELLFERISGEVDASLLTEDGRALMIGDAMSGGRRLFADALAPGRYYLLVQGHTYTVEVPYSLHLSTTPASE